MASSDERVPVTLDEALKRLAIEPDYDPGDGPKECVHTFLQAGPALIGAHWSLADVKETIEKWGVEESGPSATAMQHGLVSLREGGPVFYATKKASDGS